MKLKRETTLTHREFVEYTRRERSQFSIDNNRNSAEDNPSSFCETESLEAARDMALTGWQAGINQLEINTELRTGLGFDPVYDVTGEFIDVGAYMEGTPECFISFQSKDNFNMPRLIIYATLTYSCGVSSAKGIEYAKKLINLVNSAQSNFDVKVIGVFPTDTGKQERGSALTVDQVILKDFAETLVLNNLAAAFHPSYFRRLWFRFQENAGDSFSYGYGRTMAEDKIIKYIESKSELYKDPYIIAPSLMHLGARQITADNVKTTLNPAQIKLILP